MNSPCHRTCWHGGMRIHTYIERQPLTKGSLAKGPPSASAALTKGSLAKGPPLTKGSPSAASAALAKGPSQAV
ncbi:MAG TPA: hypothetical protein VGB29_04700 [Thermodesulfobacteriota bacterium]